MKRLILLSIAGLLAVACTNSESQKDARDETAATFPPDGSNSRIALDWDGLYRGLLPCADCEGILMEMELKSDESYTLRQRYLGKDGGTFSQAGTFAWDESGGIIVLAGMGDTGPKHYRVGENVLIQLDMDGKPITGELAPMYRLPKIADENDIRERYWILFALEGESIPTETEEGQQAHMVLKLEENRVYGYGGCNRFFGSYTMDDPGQISFSQMASSLRACEDMDVEIKFLRNLEQVVHYTLLNDSLLLKDAENEIVARFALLKL